MSPRTVAARYAGAAGLTAIATLLAAALDAHVTDADLVMVYVLAAALAGLWLGRGPAALTAIGSIACFNWFFVPPRYTFAVADGRYVLTFAVMLAVALTIASLMASIRQQAREAEASERRTSLLYAMSRELAGTADRTAMVGIAIRHVAAAFAVHVEVRSADDRRPPPSEALAVSLDAPATAPRAASLGTLLVVPAASSNVPTPEDRALLEAFAGQLALALERARLADSAASAHLVAETEALRSTLLASISHDLRTPLSVITAASTALADDALPLDGAARRDLARSIADKAFDVSQLVSNVLELLRFEGGPVPLRRDWEGVDDLAALALQRTREALAGHRVTFGFAADVPLVFVDAALTVQLLANLLENAARHTPPGTTVSISAETRGADLRVVVEDDGPGLPPGDPDRLFTKFERGGAGYAGSEAGRGGAGLGLAICRAIAAAHGGTIVAERRDAGGARFVVTLPLEGARA